MTFDILFDQPLDVRSHGYINRTREKPDGNSHVSPRKFMQPSGGIIFLWETIRHITLLQG